jgi:hypothetical protein
VRESPRICRQDSTLASNFQGSASFDTIACEFETSVERPELPSDKDWLNRTSSDTEFASSDERGEVRFLPHTLENAFLNLRESISIAPEGQEALSFADGLPSLEADVEGVLGSVEGEALDGSLLLDREHRPFALGHILAPYKTFRPRLHQPAGRKNAGATVGSVAVFFEVKKIRSYSFSFFHRHGAAMIPIEGSPWKPK